MTGKEKIVHRVAVNSNQPMVLSRRGTFALRRSRLVRRRFRQVFYTAGFILSFAAIAQASYGFLLEAPYFVVNSPRIEGVSEPLKKEILGLITTITQNNHNLLSIDSKELENQISLHPRIRDIHVEKIYPNELKITAAERQEVAIIVTGNGFYLLDKDGHVMEQLETSDLLNVKYPLVSGLGVEEVHEGEPVDSASLRNAISLLEILKSKNKQLYDRLSEIEILSDRVSPLETITAHMKGGLDIKFGDSTPVDKLPALETLLEKLNADGVKPFSDLVYIDLGYDDLGYYMDKATALVVERHQYEEVQQAMDEAASKYEKNHPETNKNKYSGGQNEDQSDDAPAKSSSRKSSSSNKTESGARTRTSPQPARYPANYRQPAAQPQYYPQQYYQQPQRQPQSAPMYNLPANQSRN